MMSSKSSRVILISLVVSLTNFWIWRTIKVNILFGAVLILLSIVLTYLIYIKLNKKIFLIALLLTLLSAYQVLASGFDNNLMIITPDQQKKIDERHGYFADSLGIFFQNKFSLRFYKDIDPHLKTYENNIFNSLSPNLYFFANHPRERANVEEFAKYPSILLIPFLIGLLYLLDSSNYLILAYLMFALGITGFVKQTYLFGPILFFPLINLLISIGFLKIYQFFLKNDI